MSRHTERFRSYSAQDNHENVIFDAVEAREFWGSWREKFKDIYPEEYIDEYFTNMQEFQRNFTGTQHEFFTQLEEWIFEPALEFHGKREL